MSQDEEVNIDDIVGVVERQIALARAQAERAQEFRYRVEAIRGSAASARRELSVTVDASGRLVGVELTQAAMRMRSQTLSRLLVETAEAARRTAGERAIGLAEDAFGWESEIVERLREEVDSPSSPMPPSGRGLR